MKKNTISYLLFVYLIFSTVSLLGQEFEGPLRWNPHHDNGIQRIKNAAHKTTATLSLPFFEDFTGYSPYPDSNKWTDFSVFINNTMCVSPISRGCATFDDLNSNGIPYDSFSNTTFRYADSLTSLPIDLSSDSSADSVYLSFFYQPQGRGFYPLGADSLMLFLKNKYGDFIKVWSVPGATLTPFQQVMIPITDSLYFHDAFQFRFVNIAALYWSDAIWNLDYIKLDRFRSAGDTTIGDVAFTTNPSCLLNDYTSMPYDQFKANPAAEIAPIVTDSIRNDTSFSQSVQSIFRLRDLNSGASICAAGPNGSILAGYNSMQVSEPVSIATYPTYPLHTSVVFQTKYYLYSTPGTGNTVNDTVIRDQVFDNYLAYDDGSAEKSYFLKLYPSLPGKIAVEYHLNRPDSLRGMAIYFGRQIPFATYKEFALYAYSSIAGVNGSPVDVIIDSSDFMTAAYADTVNHFWIYKFNNPIALPAGTFYAGIVASKETGDSLYIGLDVNRVGSNHAYYNVLGQWYPSLVGGALMMRPIIGREISGSFVTDVNYETTGWNVFPNPTTGLIRFEFTGTQRATYNVSDLMGHTVKQGPVADGGTVDLAELPAGMYFVTLLGDGISGPPHKIIKL